MKTLGVAYAATLASFLILDALWLGLVAQSFYREQLGDLMSASPSFGAAALFYLVFAAAIVFFAVRPGLDAGSIVTAVGYGAALGLAAYATYDLSNLATLRGWPLTLSMVDMLWGTILTGIASACGFAAARWST